MKRSRSYSFSSIPASERSVVPRRQYKKKRQNIPKALAYRGTPGGYYEIPVTNLFKVYYNTSTGLWQTNQDTGASQGLTGYRGFALSTSLSDVNLALGEGSISTNITQSVPGFATLQDAFDMCKIARLEVEIYFMQDGIPMTQDGSTPAAMLHVVKDLNSVNPPTSQSVILQYADVRTNQMTSYYTKQRWSFVPYSEIAGETIDGSSSTFSINRPATYMSTVTPGVAHRGLLGWIDCAQSAQNARQGFIYIKVKQIRRFKISR